jgi:hypothetical protein
MTNEKDCIYVSSRGILKSCDFYSKTPISSISYLINYNEQLNNHKDNVVIYVCNTAIKDFINNHIQYIKCDFVLVSGDSDTTVPYDIFSSREEFIQFIKNEKLIHWYSQNCIIDHSKLTRIPIGLDYHTLSECKYIWGEQSHPISQEQNLIKLRDNSKPFWEREIKCYSNFHFNFYRFGQDRIDAINNIQKNLIFYEEKQVPRIESWKTQTTYAFVVSPHGNGLDCHRTWEALILGCIVIVKQSGLDPLYEGLPVLIVSDWSDINMKLLEDTVKLFKNVSFNYNKLKLEYWMNIINNH